MSRILAYTLAAALAAAPLASQEAAEEEAGGLLVNFLQDTLSGDSRYIKVTGLEGAFSSRATIEKLTVADDKGVWLTVDGAELDWNRLALVRGRFSVNALTADRITVERSPEPVPEDPDLPAPEATPFRLPDLPVAVEIGAIRAGRIDLGAELLGTPASLTLAGALKLADGALDTGLDISRLDRPGDRLHLDAGYSNETGVISLDLTLDEAAGGLVSTALGLPGRPTVRLLAQGSGPVSGFGANIELDTNGRRRLGGSVTLAAAAAAAEGDSETPKNITFSAELNGDIDPLMQPAYRPFFGPGLRASLKGESGAGGSLTFDTIVLRTRALQLTGAVAMAPGGVLDTANLKAAVTPPDGQAAVILPLPGADTTVGSAEILARKESGADWQIGAALRQLSHPAARVASADIRGTGTLDQSGGFALQGLITASLDGFQPRDPALAQAAGTSLAFEGTVTTGGPGVLRFTGMELRGGDYRAGGELAFEGLGSGLRVTGDLTAEAGDLGRFSGLAGREIGGAATAAVKGYATPLSGAFGADLSMRGEDLSAGIAQVDQLIAGVTTLALKAERGADGLRVDNFMLNGTVLDAEARGQLSSTKGRLSIAANLKKLELLLPQLPGTLGLVANVTRDGNRLRGGTRLSGLHSVFARLDGSASLDGDADFDFDASMDELQRFVPQLPGRIAASGTASRSAGRWQGSASASGPGGIAAELEGSFDEAQGNVDLIFDAAMAELQRLVPELPGAMTAKGTASRRGTLWQAKGEATAPAGTSAQLDGSFDEAQGDVDVAFDAVVADLQRLVPDLAGQLAAKGTASRRGTLWQVDSAAAGPAGIDARLAGTWDQAEGNADLSAAGTLRLEGANPFIAPNLIKGPASFDLALRGQPGLDSLSGTVSAAGASLAIPAAAQQIDGINAQVALGQSRAQIQASARPREGGTVTVSGPVSLAAPYNGDLRIAIDNAVLTDNLLYDTLLNGRLAFSGPLTGRSRLTGRIDVGETNFNLAAAGGSVTAAPIPPIRHVAEPGAVRATRARAGLIEQGAGGSGAPDISLDVLISAPNRIFARGRGLRAELGGEIRVRGTTSRLAPSGQIGLIRGTFDIFGRRLNLDEGRVTLQGDLTPYLSFKSSSSTSEGSATLAITGFIDAPEIKVTSEPPRPSEEALALLLFGDNIQDLSPLALARLAASVAKLSGAGGGAEGKLREGTGADNAEVGFDNLGSGLLGLGGYVSENVYTDFNVNTRGESELTINLDVTNSLTVKGTVDSEGETGVGLFFKRDY